MEHFHVMLRRPFWCSKTKKQPPYWCTKPVLWELNSIFMQKSSFVWVNQYGSLSCEWKHSIKWLLYSWMLLTYLVVCLHFHCHCQCHYQESRDGKVAWAHASHQCGPGFEFWTRCHMWVEFVISTCPCSKCFPLGCLVLLPPQKPTLLNSSSIQNPRATGLLVATPGGGGGTFW